MELGVTKEWNAAYKKIGQAIVLVLGDVGRSPRMQYHALSLAEEAGYAVTLVGYSGETCFEAIQNEKKIREKRFQQPKTKSRLFNYQKPKKSIKNDQSISLTDSFKFNAYKFIERASARFLNPRNNLCVSECMRLWLATHFQIDATVFRDRPPRFFFTSSKKKNQTLLELRARLPCLQAYRPGTAVIMSSTSWSPDEDFDILLDALVQFQKTKSQICLLIIITGKGPLRSQFESRIQQLDLSPQIHIACAWLESSDYLALLQATHAGLCLHASSSGLDLPMKVLDMFGAQLPVLALDFPALPELITNNHNGLTFHDAHTLANALVYLLADFDGQSSPMARLKQNSRFLPSDDWHAHWRRSVLPLVLS